MSALKEYLRILIGKDKLDVSRPDLQDLIEWARRHFMLQRLLKQHEAVITSCEDGRATTLNEIATDNYPMTKNDARMLSFEADRVERALGHLDVPIMLLKGASYVLSGHEAGQDRRDVVGRVLQGCPPAHRIHTLPRVHQGAGAR